MRNTINEKSVNKLTRQVCLIILTRKYSGSWGGKSKIIPLSPFLPQHTEKYPFPNNIWLDYKEYCKYFNISFSTFYRDLKNLELLNFISSQRKYGWHYTLTHDKKDIFLDEDPRLYRITKMYLDHYDAIEAFIDRATDVLYDCPSGRFLIENTPKYKKLAAASWVTSDTPPSVQRGLQRDFKVLKHAAELLRFYPDSDA